MLGVMEPLAADQHRMGGLRVPRPDGGIWTLTADESVDRLAALLADLQDGAVAGRQLHAIGMTRRMVERRVGSGRLFVHRPGVYAVGHPRLSDCGKRHGAVLSAWGPGPAFVSHRSAGAEMEFWTEGREIDVTVLTRRTRAPRPGMTIHRSPGLAIADRRIHNQLAITSVERTLLDMGDQLDDRQMRRAIGEADRSDLINPHELTRVCATCPGRRGLRPLLQWLMLRLPPPLTKSEMEIEFAEFLEEHGYPVAKFNEDVGGEEFDAVWHEYKFVVELDSWRDHDKRPERFENDRKRDAMLQLAGYRILRITWYRLTAPSERPGLLADLDAFFALGHNGPWVRATPK